jgi:chloramphenicol 3-O-phosphotransferase
VILLNGASSSGKSTLAKALQRALDEPFLHVSSDQFVVAGMLPDRGGRLGTVRLMDPDAPALLRRVPPLPAGARRHRQRSDRRACDRVPGLA